MQFLSTECCFPCKALLLLVQSGYFELRRLSALILEQAAAESGVTTTGAIIPTDLPAQTRT
jgi:hypothetical protein